MLSTSIRSTALAVGLFCIAAACSTPNEIPEFDSHGSRVVEFRELDELANIATAVIVAEPTGEQRDIPLPPGRGVVDSAPTPFVTMKVLEVLAGTDPGKTIELVSPGEDVKSGRRGLSFGGPYVLFVAPAVYGPDDPAGGYVVVGGPAGVFASVGSGEFARVDKESTELPGVIRAQSVTDLKVTRSEEDVIKRGW